MSIVGLKNYKAFFTLILIKDLKVISKVPFLSFQLKLNLSRLSQKIKEEMSSDNNNQENPNKEQNQAQGLFSQNNLFSGQQQLGGLFEKPPTSLFAQQGSLFGSLSSSTQSGNKSSTSLFKTTNFFPTSSRNDNLISDPNFWNKILPSGSKLQLNEEETERKKQDYVSYWKPRIPMKSLKPVEKFKVVILGEGGIGKTAFVNNLFSKEFNKVYLATKGKVENPLDIMTNYGPFTFEIIDTAGQIALSGKREDLCIGADCAILMFDVTSRITEKEIPKWCKLISTICGNIPKVLVGNKVDDVRCRKVMPKAITFHRKVKMPYCEISAKTGYQCEKPLLYLLRMMANSDKIELLGEPIPQPEDPTLAQEEILNQLKEEENADNTPLPENKDKEFGISSQEKDE